MTDRPTTEAARVLLEQEAYNSRSFALITPTAVAAIEAEARAALIDELVAAVEGLPMTFGVHTCWDDHEGAGGTHANGSPCHDRLINDSVARAAVLRLLEGARHGK